MIVVARVVAWRRLRIRRGRLRGRIRLRGHALRLARRIKLNCRPRHLLQQIRLRVQKQRSILRPEQHHQLKHQAGKHGRDLGDFAKFDASKTVAQQLRKRALAVRQLELARTLPPRVHRAVKVELRSGAAERGNAGVGEESVERAQEVGVDQFALDCATRALGALA
jgi:hypothetical protein